MNNNMEKIKEKIELVKDRLENINATLSMPIPDRLHVQALRELLPELIEDMTETIQELVSADRVEADNIPDRLAELEKVILDYYLDKGYEIGIGGWRFSIEINSDYKSKAIKIYFCSANGVPYSQVFGVREANTKEMFDKAIEYFSTRQSEVIECSQTKD